MVVNTLTDDEILRILNTTFIVTVNGLKDEGMLTHDQVQNLYKNYSIIIERKTWLPDFLSKWLSLDKNDLIKVRLVRAIGRVEEV